MSGSIRERIFDLAKPVQPMTSDLLIRMKNVCDPPHANHPRSFVGLFLGHPNVLVNKSFLKIRVIF
jgi:hypothetical protein